jgi:hypothetical protein
MLDNNKANRNEYLFHGIVGVYTLGKDVLPSIFT